MIGQMPAHRAVAIALVALLHLILLWLLLRSTIMHVQPAPTLRAAPITLWLQTQLKEKPPEPEQKKKEKKEGAAPVTRSIGVPTPAPQGAPPATEYNGIRALGRYLTNCSDLKYENLSSRELAHCLGNQWGKPGEGGKLRLGAEAPSIWKKRMEEKRKPARKLEHECAQGSYNSNLGLPCYDFAN